MRTDLTRTAALIATTVGLVTAAATAGAGIVLAVTYRPHLPQGFGLAVSPEAVRSDQWSDLHLWAGLGLMASAAIVLALLALSALGGRWLARPLPMLSASMVAAVTAGLTLVTRSLVEWEQLALSAVTVGTNLAGYWTAAFGSGVEFVLVDGTEVSQGTYAVALVGHLAAPVVSGIALVAVGMMLLRDPRARDASDSAVAWAPAPTVV